MVALPGLGGHTMAFAIGNNGDVAGLSTDAAGNRTPSAGELPTTRSRISELSVDAVAKATGSTARAPSLV
jgi:hypothetical protein